MTAALLTCKGLTCRFGGLVALAQRGLRGERR